MSEKNKKVNTKVVEDEYVMRPFYRVLFLTNELYPNLNANSEIVYRLARVLLERHQCEVSILGYYRGIKHGTPLAQDGLTSIPIKSVSKLNSIIESSPLRLKRLVRIILSPVCYRYYLRKKLGDRFSLSKEYAHAVRHLLKKQSYDCIIGVSFPRDALVALSELKTDTPFIAYKLDPWSNRYDLQGRDNEKRYEMKTDVAASSIVVTKLIWNDYPRNTDPAIMRKIRVLEFPNIIQYSKPDRQDPVWNDKAIHCVFAGGLYKDIRNPAYTIELFRLLEKNNIVLHMYGREWNKPCLPEVLPANLIYHGEVDTDTALNCMLCADILVNIGNTVPNQMPSKILTYISLGKPILNIIKHPACPSLPYMEKYPLALNVLETEQPAEADAARVRDFILENKEKRIPFEEVARLYSDCTPEYVGGRLYELIRQAVENRQGRAQT